MDLVCCRKMYSGLKGLLLADKRRSFHERKIRHQKELKRKFSKITLDYCGHLLENHINKTDEQLQRRLKDNRNLRVASSFYGEKSQIMQTIKEDLLSEDSLDQLTDYFLDQEWKDPYFLYFQIPEGIKAAAYKFDHKHNWKKELWYAKNIL